MAVTEPQSARSQGPRSERGRPPAAAPFEAFAARISPRLRQGLVATLGIHAGAEAHALAMEYAWQHAERVMPMDHPVAYLYRVGRSRVRNRRHSLPLYLMAAEPADLDVAFEPKLAVALAQLPRRQAIALFLVVGCEWSAAEVGRLLGRSESTVRKNVELGAARLKKDLGVSHHEP